MTRRILVVALTGALLGCTSAAEPDYATLDVELTYLERIALPPGAMAVAALRQNRAPISGPDNAASMVPRGSGEVMARNAVAIAGSVPVRVSLRYDRSLLDPARALVVDGWIYADDQVLFAVPEPPRVRPVSAGQSQLTLRRLRHVVFACDDKSQPSIAFPAMGGELAFLENTGATPVVLRAQPVGSGFHYGGSGFDLRGKGTEAILKRPAGGETRCVASQP